MTFEIAGMYPSTAYQMVAQTITAGKVTNGTTLSFTTGALPTTIPFPTFTVKVPAGPETYSTDAVILHGLTAFGPGDHYPDAATDLSGEPARVTSSRSKNEAVETDAKSVRML